MKRTSAIGLIMIWAAAWVVTVAMAAPAVVTSEGKYVMGDLDTKKDARTLALMEAKRLALEKVGTYIESSSEVQDFKLTKDQINTLASGIMSVEVLKEDWKMSGESMVAVVEIRATVDTSNLKARIARLNEDPAPEGYKEIQGQLEALKKELADLKTQKASPAPGGAKEPPKADLKEKHEGIIKKMSALEFMEKGQAALMNQRWQDGDAAFTEALKLNSRLVDAYAGKSFALHKMNRTREALEVVNAALAIDPQSVRGLATKAMILTSQGLFDEALEAINRAIALRPKNPRLYFQRGEIYVKLQKRGPASFDFQKACEMGLPKACERGAAMKAKPQKRYRPVTPRSN